MLIGIFLFFSILLFFVPITGDDWYNYVIGQKGVFSSISNTFRMYFTWEGRIVSRLLIYLLTSHRFIYIIVTSFSLTALCYFIANIYLPKYKYFLYFVALSFLLTLENTVWTQSFLWVAGSITYLYPCILFVGYLYYYFRVIRYREKLFWYHYFFSSLFSFFLVMFVENLAVSYLVFHFVTLFYQFYKTKKIDRYLLSNVGVAMIGFSFMLFSPGSATRTLVDHPGFQSLSLFSKIKINIPNFMHYTFLCNIPFMILLLATYLLLIFRGIQSRWKYFVSLFVFSFFSGVIVILIFHQYYISNYGWDFLFSHLYLLVFTIVILGFLFLLLLFKFCKKERAICFLLALFVALSNNLVMFFSPVWGGRVAFFTIFSLFFLFVYFLLHHFSFFSSKSFFLFFATFTIIMMSCTLLQYFSVYRFTQVRERKIEEQLQEKEKFITIYTMPNHLLWGNDPYDEFHIDYFKEYYHIPDDAVLIYQTYFKN